MWPITREERERLRQEGDQVLQDWAYLHLQAQEEREERRRQEQERRLQDGDQIIQIWAELSLHTREERRRHNATGPADNASQAIREAARQQLAEQSGRERSAVRWRWRLQRRDEEELRRQHEQRESDEEEAEPSTASPADGAIAPLEAASTVMKDGEAEEKYPRRELLSCARWGPGTTTSTRCWRKNPCPASGCLACVVPKSGSLPGISRASYLPSSLASAAALAGLVTAVKSSWELSRMIKKKYNQRVLKDHADDINMRLRRALRNGRISQQNYNFWKKKVMIAVWEHGPLNVVSYY
ncbi:hypothetical protein QBC40DRAFT_302453 [Triangularia verruculosa]|uniref:Uncharacterized protein n=1 Tax=Triangularia verruculosa TaxID=2587418 RepID=A0AAN6X4T8_9PEZI|nr:hypothetical protein QBC40DRAFT_302453 [Triangularia verruculosa]